MVFIHADLMIIYFVSDLSQYYMTMAALCILTSPNFCSMCQDPVGEQIYVFCSSSMTSVWKYFPIIRDSQFTWLSSSPPPSRLSGRHCSSSIGWWGTGLQRWGRRVIIKIVLWTEVENWMLVDSLVRDWVTVVEKGSCHCQDSSGSEAENWLLDAGQDGDGLGVSRGGEGLLSR